ncbi:DsbA family protein, partial [Mycobacterium sp. E735]
PLVRPDVGADTSRRPDARGRDVGAPPHPVGWGVGPPWGQPPRPSRKPWLWVGVAATALVAIVGVALAVVRPWESAPRPEPTKPPPPADAVALRVLDDGVFVGSSAASTTIDIFNEPICPPCGSFIRSNAGDIDTAVNNKKLAVRYHLLDFLDDKSHSKNYSTRAVAASYCVAAQSDPKTYTAFYSGLFASNFQPAEDAAEDRTDGELAQLAKNVGADADVLTCIKSGDDVGTGKAKSAAGYATLSGLNANSTPFVWDGTASVNYSDPTWLTKLLG